VRTATRKTPYFDGTEMVAMSLVGQSGDMAQLPAPLRALIGLVATVTQDGHELSDKTVELSVQAVSNALQLSLRAQQHYAALTVRGDELLAQMRGGPPDDAPDWARFDDEEPAAPDATVGAQASADSRTDESSVSKNTDDQLPTHLLGAIGRGVRRSSSSAAKSPTTQPVKAAKTAKTATATAAAAAAAAAAAKSPTTQPVKPAKAAAAAAAKAAKATKSAAPKPAQQTKAAAPSTRRARPTGAKTITAPRNGRLSAFDQTTEHGDDGATWPESDMVDGASD
jgi:hypothetical protein